MRIAVSSLQVSRSISPAHIPMVGTPINNERVNLHHSQIFNKDSPQNSCIEKQQLIELETRILNLEQDSTPKLTCEKLIEENKKLIQQVNQQNESAVKFKGELKTAKKEISKLKKLLDIKEEALTDIRIKNHCRNFSNSEKLKNDKLNNQKQMLEQQYLREKQNLTNQIQQLEQPFDYKSSNNTETPQLYHDQQQKPSQNGQIQSLISKSSLNQQTSNSLTFQVTGQNQSALNKISFVYSQDGDQNSIYQRPNNQDSLYQVQSRALKQEVSSPKYNNQSLQLIKQSSPHSIPQEQQEANILNNQRNNKSNQKQEQFKKDQQQKGYNVFQRKSLSSISQQISVNEHSQGNKQIDKFSIQTPKHQSSGVSTISQLNDFEELKKEAKNQKQVIQEQIHQIIKLEQEKIKEIEKNQKFVLQFQNQSELIQNFEFITNNFQKDITGLEQKILSQKMNYESQIQDQQNKYKLLEKQFEESKLIVEKLSEENQTFSFKYDQEIQLQNNQFKKEIEEKQLEIINLTQKVLNYKNKNDIHERQINQLQQNELKLKMEIEQFNKQYDQIKNQFQDTQNNLNHAKDQIQIIQSQYQQEFQLRERLELNYAILQQEFSQFKENSFIQIDVLKNQQKEKDILINSRKVMGKQDTEKVVPENKVDNLSIGLDFDNAQQLIKSNMIIDEQKKQILQLQQENQNLEDQIIDISNKLSNQELLLNQIKQEQQYQFYKCKQLKLDLSRICLDEEQLQSNCIQQLQIDLISLEDDSLPNINDQVQQDLNQINQKLQKKDHGLVIQKQQIEQILQINQEQKNQIFLLQSEVKSLEIITNDLRQQIQIQEKATSFYPKNFNQQKINEINDYDKPQGSRRSSCLREQKTNQVDFQNKNIDDTDKYQCTQVKQSEQNEINVLNKRLQQQSQLNKQLNQQLDKCNLMYQNLSIELQSNNLQLELQKSEYDQMKKHLQSIISQQKFVIEQKENEIKTIKQKMLQINERDQFEKDKIDQMIILSSEKMDIKQIEILQDSLKQDNNILKKQLQRIQNENMDLQDVVTRLQKENMSFRENNQKLIQVLEENEKQKEQFFQAQQDSKFQKSKNIILDQKFENYLPDYPKPGFITSKANKKMDEFESDNIAQQKEISKLRQIIRELSNNQNYDINQIPERKLSNHVLQLSQKKHLFDQNSIKCKKN